MESKFRLANRGKDIRPRRMRGWHHLFGTPVNIIIGWHVWAEDPEVAWIDGEVIDIKGNDVTIVATNEKTVDLDVGNYEWFLNVRLTRGNNITIGKIYQIDYKQMKRLIRWKMGKIMEESFQAQSCDLYLE